MMSRRELSVCPVAISWIASLGACVIVPGGGETSWAMSLIASDDRIFVCEPGQDWHARAGVARHDGAPDRYTGTRLHSLVS